MLCAAFTWKLGAETLLGAYAPGAQRRPLGLATSTARSMMSAQRRCQRSGAIIKIPAKARTPAYDADGLVRPRQAPGFAELAGGRRTTSTTRTAGDDLPCWITRCQ